MECLDIYCQLIIVWTFLSIYSTSSNQWKIVYGKPWGWEGPKSYVGSSIYGASHLGEEVYRELLANPTARWLLLSKDTSLPVTNRPTGSQLVSCYLKELSFFPD